MFQFLRQSDPQTFVATLCVPYYNCPYCKRATRPWQLPPFPTRAGSITHTSRADVRLKYRAATLHVHLRHQSPIQLRFLLSWWFQWLVVVVGGSRLDVALVVATCECCIGISCPHSSASTNSSTSSSSSLTVIGS